MVDLGTPPSTPAPAPRADVGVLLVHGIGDHGEGETLISFGEPLVDWLREWLRGSGDENARGSVRVTEARLRATRTEAVSPAYAQVEVSLAAEAHGKAREQDADAADVATSERWLMTEAWWGDSVHPPRTLRLMGWLLTRGPLLVYWHFYLGPLRNAYEVRLRDMFMALLALSLAGLIQFVVLVAMVLWLIPFGPWRRAVSSAVRALTLTLGDSFVLLEQDFQSAALVRRVERSLDWLALRADRLIVVAHSQGGAIAHEALRRVSSHQVAAFISIGSGLEKLYFLRHVRDKRGGLAAAALLAPLTLLCAPVLLAGGLSDPDERWIASFGVLLLVALLAAYGVLAEALFRYREELTPRMSELALRTGREPIVWHDLYATHDVVPMGKGSLLDELPFIKRQQVANQRSYLNDHISYFENRLGCVPLLWQLLAKHSRMALFRSEDSDRLQRLLEEHAAHSRVLWFSGRACWAAGVLTLFVLRDSLVGFGASVQHALDRVELASLTKPFQLLGSLAAWVSVRVGLRPASVEADRPTAALLAISTLGLAMLVWWLLFRVGWFLRAAAAWRKACLQPELLDAHNGPRIRYRANILLWLTFGSAPLLVAGIFFVAPAAPTLHLLARAAAAVMALLMVLVAWAGALGWPWLLSRLAPASTETLVARLLGPAIASWIVALFLASSRWFWPTAWGPSVIEAIVAASWGLAALAWLVWLALAGSVIYGRRGAAGWALLILAAVALSMRLGWVDATLSEALADLSVLIVSVLTLAQTVQCRAELWAVLRTLPLVRALLRRGPPRLP